MFILYVFLGNHKQAQKCLPPVISFLTANDKREEKCWDLLLRDFTVEMLCRYGGSLAGAVRGESSQQ